MDRSERGDGSAELQSLDVGSFGQTKRDRETTAKAWEQVEAGLLQGKLFRAYEEQGVTEKKCCRLACDDRPATVYGFSLHAGPVYFCDDCYDKFVGFGLRLKRFDGEPLAVEDAKVEAVEVAEVVEVEPVQGSLF